MNPSLFSVDVLGHHLDVMSYSFFYFCAAIFVTCGVMTGAIKSGFNVKKTNFLIIVMVICGFLGARVLHFFMNPTAYEEISMVFTFHMSRFTIVGGLLFVAIGGYITGKLIKMDVWKFADMSIPFIAGGIAIARFGCFLNGCCFGHVTSVPWGVTFPFLSPAHVYQISHGFGSMFGVQAVHPTQLYEMIAVIAGGSIAYVITKKRMFDGAAVLFFGMWYSAFRLMNGFFRVTADSLILTKIQYSIIYIMIFLTCLSFFVYRYKKSR